MEENSIFIALNTVSSKNSKQIVNSFNPVSGKRGKRIISSKLTLNYEERTHILWQMNKEKFLKMIEGKEKPYRVGLFFIRDSKRKFDYINVSQILFDLMQKHEYIEDDSMDHVVPVFEGYRVDKPNAGVIIKIL